MNRNMWSILFLSAVCYFFFGLVAGFVVEMIILAIWQVLRSKTA